MTDLQQETYIAPGGKSNVKHVEGYLRYAPSTEYQDQVRDVINLYKDKTIRSYKRADNLVTELRHARYIQ